MNKPNKYKVPTPLVVLLAGVAFFTSTLIEKTMNNSEPKPDLVLTDSEIEIINNSFTTTRDYWLAKTAGMEAVKLTVISGEATEECKQGDSGDVYTARDPALVYCYASKTVIVSPVGVKLIELLTEPNGVGNSDAIELALAHESGHAYQQTKPNFIKPRTSEELKAHELQADCLAGEFIAANDPRLLSVALSFYATIGDPDHGSSTERLASFSQGATTGEC